MDDKMIRLLLFMLVAFLIIQVFGPKPTKPGPEEGPTDGRRTTDTLAATATGDDYSTTTLGDAGATGTLSLPAPEEQGEDILLRTETYEIRFNTAGARPTSWKIIDPEFAIVVQADVDEAREAGVPEDRLPRVGEFKPLELIPQYPGLDEDYREYPLSLYLKETGGKFHNALNRGVYQTDGPVSDPDTGDVTIDFRIETADGLRVVKSLRFPSNGYLVDLNLSLENPARPGAQNFAFTETIQPGLGLGWGPGIGEPEAEGWDRRFFTSSVYDEKVRSEKLNNVKKVAEGERVEKSFIGDLQYGCIDSRFYMAALLPRGGGFVEDEQLAYFSIKRSHLPRGPGAATLLKNMSPPTTLELYSGPFRLDAGQARHFDYRLFVGPKKRELLTNIDKQNGTDLAAVMFHSTWTFYQLIIRPLVVFMLKLLNIFHDWTNNYGVAIILLVLVMRLLTQPFTHISMKSMAQVKAEQMRIKPLIDAINEKYKDDPQKKSAETWKTYREHGVNPLGMLKGCVWMLIQMPIFLALYGLLMGAVDLRGEGFLWISDLTAPDALFTLPFSLPFLGNKFNILPILMGVSQVFAQKLQSAEIEDPMQKQMMYMMPIMFIFILYNFAAGLSLYWFVSNLWQISFQIFVNKRVREEAERKAAVSFEQRQKAMQERSRQGGAEGPAKKPGFMERMQKMVEEKAREAEARQRDKQSGKTAQKNKPGGGRKRGR